MDMCNIYAFWFVCEWNFSVNYFLLYLIRNSDNFFILINLSLWKQYQYILEYMSVIIT